MTRQTKRKNQITQRELLYANIMEAKRMVEFAVANLKKNPVIQGYLEAELSMNALRQAEESFAKAFPQRKTNNSDALAPKNRQRTEGERTLIRLPQVKNLTGLSRSSIYSRSKDGRFPSPVDLGGRAVAWVESEIRVWLEQRKHKDRDSK